MCLINKMIYNTIVRISNEPLENAWFCANIDKINYTFEEACNAMESCFKRDRERPVIYNHMLPPNLQFPQNAYPKLTHHIIEKNILYLYYNIEYK